MKTLNETFLVTAFTFLWLIVLPLAGLFEIVVILSDKVEALTIHHVETASL
jgi:hypothetical protein